MASIDRYLVVGGRGTVGGWDWDIVAVGKAVGKVIGKLISSGGKQIW